MCGRVVLWGMALNGTYVPSTTQWVRDNVEEYESTNGEKGGTLPGTPYPIVVVTSVGREVRQPPQEPGDAGRA